MPFNINNSEAYLPWREHKLKHAITHIDELLVEIKNPLAITIAEQKELLTHCQRSNMVVYASHVEMDEHMLQQFAAQLGLTHLDANWLAGEQGITRITICKGEGPRQSYIPYTDRAIKWHTDGYYNPSDRRIHGMLLHCAQSAGQGGDNRVMDHEIAYLMLRDANPDFIRALSAPDVLTIPERVDAQDGIRPAQTGPVFSLNKTGQLHMRYTARTRSIEWKQDEQSRAALAYLEQILSSESPHIHSLQLNNGMGLLCNNVLHERTAFNDDPLKPRLLYRARYLQRLTSISEPLIPQ